LANLQGGDIEANRDSVIRFLEGEVVSVTKRAARCRATWSANRAHPGCSVRCSRSQSAPSDSAKYRKLVPQANIKLD
jgi:hypothetical protein